MSEDYYKVLGIDKNSSKSDIKKAFHKLAHKYHPDKKGGDEVKFKKINEAYTILSNDKKRAEYDAYGRVFNDGSGGGQAYEGFRGGGFDFSQFSQQGGMEFDLGDIFGDIFSGGRPRAKRGNDISIDLQISFKEAVFGVSRKVSLTKNSVCDKCEGTGGKRGTSMKICSVCNGNGKIHETKRSMLGTFSSVRACEDCRGTGQVPKEKCESCRGQGVKKDQTEISINVPAGINDGEMIRLTGAGEAIVGGTPGDLYVKIHVASHSLFKKEGFNLTTDLNIKLTDALLGAEYTLETLDGKIKIKVPAGVNHKEILRVKGKGVPMGGSKRGDVLVKIKIELPSKINRKIKELIEELKKEGI